MINRFYGVIFFRLHQSLFVFFRSFSVAFFFERCSKREMLRNFREPIEFSSLSLSLSPSLSLFLSFGLKCIKIWWIVLVSVFLCVSAAPTVILNDFRGRQKGLWEKRIQRSRSIIKGKERISSLWFHRKPYFISILLEKLKREREKKENLLPLYRSMKHHSRFIFLNIR